MELEDAIALEGFAEKHGGLKRNGEMCFDAESLDALCRDVAAREREVCANVCESFRDEARERRLEGASREAEGTGDELTILRNWSECRLWNAAHERSAAAIRERSNV